MAALTTALENGTHCFLPTLYPTAHPSSRPAAGLPLTSKARHAAPVDANVSSYSGMARRDDSRGRRRDRRFRGDSQSSSMSTSAKGDSGDSTTRGSATPLAYFSAGGGATQSSKVIGPGGRRGVGRRTGGAAIGGVRGGERGGGGITYGASAGDGGGARGTASRRGGDCASSGESSGETRGGAAVSGDGSRGGAGSGAGFGSGAWRRRTAAAPAAGGGAGVDVALRQQRCGGVRLQQNMIKVAGRPRNRSSCAGAALLGQPRSQSTIANLLCQGTLSYLILHI